MILFPFAALPFRVVRRHRSAVLSLLLASLMASSLASRASGQSPVSDDFNGTSLNTSLWTVVAPAGGSVAVSSGHLVITVPGGSNHDAFKPALDAVQAVQQVSNADFDVNVKIDSTVASSAAYSGTGILVEGDAKDYIRFGVGASGSSITLGANTIIAGVESTPFQTSPFSAYVVPTYLRLNRTGTTYTGYYSSNGVNWTKAGSFSDSSLTVTGLAPYGWNYQTTPSNAPALTASFDWFHNTNAPTVATPTFSPASGTTFISTLSVSINETTTGSTIYYTTDGSTPTTSSQVYSSPITIDASTTINAIAVASGVSSAVATATYTSAPVATPTFSPVSGTTFTSTLSVSINETTSGSTIYYTTDGSTPSTSSQVYSSPITINTSTTIKAIAVVSGVSSSVGTATYNAAPVSTPTFSPVSGRTFTSTLSVSINETTSGSTIYYTTDGSTPSTSSQVYSSPITISASTTINAIAVASGVSSGVGTASYTLTTGAPGAPVSDDFNGTSLNTSVWTVVAPAGGSAAVSNGHLVITVPAGSNHDAFKPALDAVQVVQQISNNNFDVNVKIDSTLATSAAYSGPGILVEGDATDYIRFGIGASGSSITLGANTIIGGSESTPFQISPFSKYAVPTYLRLNRTGNTYTGYYSADGVNWTEAGSFTDSSLTVTGLAPYGWNYQTTPSNAPALTASFDWFHNTTTTATVAAPTFNPTSGTSFSSTLSVSIADSTSASTIYYTTDGSTPTTASKVYSVPITIDASTTINAVATASGFAQSGVASASYTQSAAVAATPTISPANGTTFISTLSVSMSDTTSGATIYYTTNGSTPTTSSTVYSAPFTISATTTVKAIAGGGGFTSSGVASSTYTLTTESGGVVSDNLDESALNTSLWTLENPLGDGTVVMTGSGANLNVPMGKDHDLGTSGDNAVRIMQPVSNSNFSVDARFQSAVEIGNQDEGILVEQDSGDFLRFDVVFSGTTGKPELFAEGVTGSTATTFINTPIALAQGPLVLRLARNVNVWTCSYSTDGTTFTSAPSFTFDLNAAKVGPYAGASNATASNSPAFTATVDYFFATSDPIANQDGPKPYGWVTVDANPASTLVEKALADIQGTGHLEPVIGLERESQANDNGASGIYWYSYPSTGNVNGTWVRHTIIGSGDGYEDMVPFDVNGDGAVDIVASFDPTFSGDPEIVWFENPRGSGGNPQNTWTMHVIGPGLGENNLLMADIDGDGKMDVVTPSSVFFQNSPTSWTQKQYSGSFRGVAVLDIGSGHGAINLAGTQPGSPYNVVWWENPRETGGNARTGTWIMHSIGSGYPCSPDNCSSSSGSGEVAAYNATDVNGDGRMDVISGQSEGPGGGIAPPPGGMIWWQAPSDRRNGSWIKHVMDATLIDVHKIQVGDMDKNGTLDIEAAEQDQSLLNRVAVFYNDGKGNLTEQIISNAKGHNDAIGDVIGNGALDILNSGHGYFNDSHPLQIFLNPY
jgi:Chitobiase/beta-hexosaminidase C-terminal domain/Beta xylosidase C-terminal Concanavalin A-like domain